MPLIALEHLFFFHEAFQPQQEGNHVFQIEIHLTSAGFVVQDLPESFDIHTGKAVFSAARAQFQKGPAGRAEPSVHIGRDSLAQSIRSLWPDLPAAALIMIKWSRGVMGRMYHTDRTS